MTNDDSLIRLATQLGIALTNHGWMLATAESCTGGWVSEAVTAIAGSSKWFDRGFVTYSNQAKQDMLKVKAETLENVGAVSEETAIEMLNGAIAHSTAHVAVAITGIAGPDGGTPQKPVGTVWIAWGGRNLSTKTHCYYFQGDRYAVRLQATQHALDGLIRLCAQEKR